MRRPPAVGAVILTVTLVAALVWHDAPMSARQQAPTFRAVVDVVTIDAFAHRDRQPLVGLSAADFIVRDNGVEQRIDALGTTDSAHIIIGLDLSGSVDGEILEQLRNGVRAVTRQLTSRDRVSLFTFADGLRVLARAQEPHAGLDLALVQMKAGGSTTLNDAVVLGSTLARTDERPAVLLLFTDGEDTGSWATGSRALDVLRRTDVVVYPIGAGLADALTGPLAAPYFEHPTWIAPTASDSLRMLQALADTSGGEFLRVRRDARLAETFAGILARYRTRYLLSFTPASAGDGRWHRLEVRLRTRPGAVVAREGYMARSQ